MNGQVQYPDKNIPTNPAEFPGESPMTNSHLLVNEFDYLEAGSIDEACTLLLKYDGKARLIAGGTDLVVLMKMERTAPQVLINISRIPGLDEILVHSSDGTLSIGPLATIYQLHTHPVVRARYPGLAEACASFGSTQVEVMGTLGGNICNGSPAADTPPILMAYCAQLLLAGPKGKRILPIDEFFLGPGKTALQPGEMLVDVSIPSPDPGTGSVFIKTSRVAADLAKASLGICLTRQGNTITGLRMAMGSVAPKPIRLPRTEALLIGQVFTPELAARAGECVAEEISPIDDVRSTAWYRRQAANVMVQDGLAIAWHRAAEPAASDAAVLPAQWKKTYPARQEKLEAGSQRKLNLRVNGVARQVWVAPNELLLNVLRERFELTGTKYACGIGECSACTVHIDGQPALACLVLAAAADGKEITTIEGLQDPEMGTLDPLQEAFIDNTAFQCGYCTPGVIMTAKSLLEENRTPSEEDVRQYLRGNMCRCTGYASIVRAVLKSVE